MYRVVQEPLWFHLYLLLISVDYLNILMLQHFTFEWLLPAEAAQTILALKRVQLLARQGCEVGLISNTLFDLAEHGVNVLGALLGIHRKLTFAEISAGRVVDSAFVLAAVCCSVDIRRCRKIGREPLIKTVALWNLWVIRRMVLLLHIAKSILRVHRFRALAFLLQEFWMMVPRVLHRRFHGCEVILLAHVHANHRGSATGTNGRFIHRCQRLESFWIFEGWIGHTVF